MKSYFIHLREYLTGSFWFIPTVLIICAFLLSEIALYFDSIIQIQNYSYLRFLEGSVEGYRTLLSTIAGSLMSIVGIVFSMTLVALTLAAGQYGSRVLGNFMKSRFSQFVLGAYVAAFVYCMLILRVVKVDDFSNQNVDISVFLALILMLVNIYLLILYIHYIAKSIQVRTIIQKISTECYEQIQLVYPKSYEHNDQKSTNKIKKYKHVLEIPSNSTGYIEFIDTERILDIATSEYLYLKIHYTNGEYVYIASPLIEVHSNAPLNKKILGNIRECISVGDTQITSHNVVFPMGQLVEIATRALSPGINDPVTAKQCLDILSSLLAHLGDLDLDTGDVFDTSGILRYAHASLSYPDFLHLSLEHIQYYAKNSPDVLVHITNIIKNLLKLPLSPNAHAALLDFKKDHDTYCHKHIHHSGFIETVKNI